MRFVVIALALVVACKQGGDDYPIGVGGGGGGTGGGGTSDGNVIYDALLDGGLIARVCLAADPRMLTTCSATGAGGFTVTLGPSTATTADDGTFSLTAPTGTNLVWEVTGTTIMTSVMPFGTGSSIPALAITTYSDLEDGNSVIPVTGQGSIMAIAIHAGLPLAGATAQTNPIPDTYPTFYDSANNENVWVQTVTGPQGVSWVTSIDANTNTSFSLLPMGATTPIVTTGLPVGDQTITFITIDVP